MNDDQINELLSILRDIAASLARIEKHLLKPPQPLISGVWRQTTSGLQFIPRTGYSGWASSARPAPLCDESQASATFALPAVWRKRL
jgi:hypothetical protein